MAVITYTAKRSLVAGHTAGEEYSINIPLTQWDRSTRRVMDTSRALSGMGYTRLHRVDEFYSVATIPINSETQIQRMREFLASVSGGEGFSIDPYGTGEVFQCSLEDDPAESRIAMTYFSFSFQVRTA